MARAESGITRKGNPQVAFDWVFSRPICGQSDGYAEIVLDLSFRASRDYGARCSEGSFPVTIQFIGMSWRCGKIVAIRNCG